MPKLNELFWIAVAGVAFLLALQFIILPTVNARQENTIRFYMPEVTE